MWREFAAYSAPQRLPPRRVAVIVASGFVVAAAVAVTAAFGREELGTGLLLLVWRHMPTREIETRDTAALAMVASD